MKKIMCALFALSFVLTSFGLTVAATGEGVFVYDLTVDGVDYTVEFLDDSVPQAEREDFAERLVAGEGAAHNRAFCNYDDHIYGSASPTVIITHKVFENEPRCVLERMDVYTCKVCGWQKFHQLSVTYTFCCPED